MLSQLYIENIAVIEKADIAFENGFLVLTGETGAGKSIIIDAINTILGGRTSRDMIRTGADTAFVSAVFTDISATTKSLLDENGIEVADDSLHIQRKISRDGKSIIKINGRPFTAAILRQIGQTLINIHGQHDNQDLLNVDNHLSYLDKLAGCEELLKKYQEKYSYYKNTESKLLSMQTDEGEKNRKIDMLKYQIEEISSANIKIGEKNRLEKEREYLENAEHINSLINAVHIAVNGNEETTGALNLMQISADKVSEAKGLYSDVSDLSQKCDEALYLIEDISAELRGFLSIDDTSPERMNEVQDRLDIIDKMLRKYGSSEESVLEYLEKSVNELEILESSEYEIAKIEEEVSLSFKQAQKYADMLTDVRKKAVKIFAGQVREELTFLDMPQIRLAVAFKRIDMTSTGCDAVEFLLSANPGEDPKSIAKIASGGELARIMLAIKNVLAEKDDINTLIFDEVDTGISGRAAFKVGKKLSDVSKSRQVICVTHLAQIAAQGDVQMLIAKHIRDGKTYTDVSILDREERKRELARIIGGDLITEATLKSAEEMLDN